MLEAFRRSAQKLSAFLQSSLFVLITFVWEHPDPLSVREFKLYSGISASALSVVQTIQRSGTSAIFQTQVEVDISTPSYYAISAVNNFGESEKSEILVVGKPSAPTLFRVME